MHHEPALAYVVADGARARLVLRHGDGRYTDIASLDHEGHHRAAHDTRGRVFASTGSARSAIEEPDADRARQKFAVEIAKAVDELIGKKAFDRFVLVAPPRMLSAIREKLHNGAAKALVGELAKDLTKVPELELHKALDHLALQAKS